MKFADKGNVMLCGDFNGRVATLNDFVMHDSYDILSDLWWKYYVNRSDDFLERNRHAVVNFVDQLLGKYIIFPFILMNVMCSFLYLWISGDFLLRLEESFFS